MSAMVASSIATACPLEAIIVLSVQLDRVGSCSRHNMAPATMCTVARRCLSADDLPPKQSYQHTSVDKAWRPRWLRHYPALQMSAVLCGWWHYRPRSVPPPASLKLLLPGHPEGPVIRSRFHFALCEP